MPRKRPSTNQSSTTRPESDDEMHKTRRKSNPTSKRKSPLPLRTTPPYFVLDTILPSHVVNDRSLFTTYTPSDRVYRSAFGHDITIAGTGNVEICVQAGAGKTVTFTVRDCWHIPSSSQNFLSCLTVTSPTRNHQVILAARTPRLLFPHKDRLATPKLPKYVPFTREQGYFVLKFKVPPKVPVALEPVPSNTLSRSQTEGFFSLHASSCPKPFAGLTFNRHSFSSSSHSLLTSSPSPQSNFDVPSSHSPIEVPISPLSSPFPTFQPQSINHSHELTTLPPAAPLPTTIYPVPLQHNPPPQPQQHHVQYRPSSWHLPLPPSLLPPTHHPPPPTVVFLPMITTPPSLISHYPISQYIPHSPTKHGYQPVQQPGVTVAASPSEVTHTQKGFQHQLPSLLIPVDRDAPQPCLPDSFVITDEGCW